MKADTVVVFLSVLVVALLTSTIALAVLFAKEKDSNEDVSSGPLAEPSVTEVPSSGLGVAGGTGTTLLLIDVQNCFHSFGELPIATADADSDRIAAMILDNMESIDRIILTQDSHFKNHIAQPGFWLDAEGNHPQPYTPISYQEVVEGVWSANPNIKLPAAEQLIDPEYFEGYEDIIGADNEIDLQLYALEYTRRLEASDRFSLFIWPEHCLMGTSGHNIYEPIREATLQWSATTGRSPEWVMKGRNLLTEFFSSVRSEVVLNGYTDFNMDYVNSLYMSDRLLVGGQAKSHCVNFSLRDILSVWPEDETNKISLLVDGSSAVPGFEEAAQDLEDYLEEVGANLISVEDAFP